MPRNPLGEVFGYPATSMTADAVRHRRGKLCPFHNTSGLTCTKNSATDPLGVCSVVAGTSLAITCPIRFRQDYLIVADAAEFFFPGHNNYLAITEVRLDDRHGKSAGNLDIVLVALDNSGEIIDFGALEVQAVYISGNIGNVFKAYMADPERNAALEWPSKNYPKPDFLSSSRKRLAPQLIYKGGILNSWGKKLAVAVQKSFFDQLPALPSASVHEADFAWMVYDLVSSDENSQYKLQHVATHYTSFRASLAAITNPEAGDVHHFVSSLSARMKTGKLTAWPQSSSMSPDVEPPLSVE